MATDSVEHYALIYVALVGLATSKFAFRHLDVFGHLDAVAATVVTATFIVAYYQHRRRENRSSTALVAQELALFLLLMIAASFSIP